MLIISPDEVAPTLRPGATPDPNGRGHRRVLSLQTGGPRAMDVGYNTFAPRSESAPPYAYTKDEFCYQAAGEMRSLSYDIKTASGAGTFMWRPAGAPTHGLTIAGDAISICAFGPAREDDWGHRLPPESIAPLNGDPATFPPPRRIHYSAVEPSPYPHAPQIPGIVYREIFSAAKTASRFMDVSHTAFTQPTALAGVTGPRHEVWWLECGEILVSSGGEARSLRPHDFLYREASETLDLVAIAGGSVVIGYAAQPL